MYRDPTSLVTSWLCCDSPSNAHSIPFSLFSEENEIKQSSLLGVSGGQRSTQPVNILFHHVTQCHGKDTDSEQTLRQPMSSIAERQ